MEAMERPRGRPLEEIVMGENIRGTSRKLQSVTASDRIMDYIQKNNLAPGDKLPNEYDLAGAFHVSRGTVREAVQSLSARGVLEVRRGSGTYVLKTALPEQDPLGLGGIRDKYKLAMDLCDIRLLIEPEMAALGSVRASKEEIRKLIALRDEVEHLYRTGLNHLDADRAFHTLIARTSGNQVAENVIPLISTAVVTFGNLTHRLLMDETISSHQAIVDAYLRRDPTGARCAMVMHLTYNRQMIEKLWEQKKASEEKT